MKEDDKFIVLSPDSITIDHELYDSEDEARQAAIEWAKRFEVQGYYSSNRYGRIPFEDVLDNCTIIQQGEMMKHIAKYL